MIAYHQLKRCAVALLLIAALSFAESAVAVTRVEEASSVTVHYGDLDLNSPQGIAGLYARIRFAAVDVCRTLEGPRFVNRVFLSEWNECVSHAIANAVKNVHNEKLSAYHWERIRERTVF